MESCKSHPSSIESVDDVIAYFPTTPQEIQQISRDAQKDAERIIASIIATPPEKFSFDVIFGNFDKAAAIMARTINLFEIMGMLNPDKHCEKLLKQKAFDYDNILLI